MIEHTYTVRELRQALHWDDKATSPSASLSLDKQEGGPVLGWPSLPATITLCGNDLCDDLALGMKVRLKLDVLA